MPVKVKCRGCEKVLNVPDKARGKSIRCPNCETVLKIPAGRTSAGGPRRKTAGKPKQKATVPRDDDDFLGGLDLRRAADRRVRVCVKCGAEAPEYEDEELIDCPECGHNIDTGVMSEYMRKKRSRKGPDPEEFWGVMWSGSFKFMRDNLPLVFRTGLYWSVFYTLAVFSFFSLVYTTNLPPKLFWTFCMYLFLFGAAGWYWYLSIQVIRHTSGPKRKKPMEKIHFDLYQCIALGLKAAVWPAVMALPVVLILAGIHLIPLAMGDPIYDDFTITTIVGLVIYVFAAILFPIAMVHMSMPYTYQAWLPVNMTKLFFRIPGPVLYWFVLFLAAITPLAIALSIIHFVWEGGLPVFVFDMRTMTFDFLDWFLENTGLIVPKNPLNARAWYLVIFIYSIALIPIAAVITPLCIIFSFSAVFLARANAYIALYFRDKLDLIDERKPDVLCGFGPRYVAVLVDALVLAFFLAILFVVQHYAGVFFTNLGIDYLSKVLLGAWALSCVVIPWLYYARPESASSVRASIGKHGVGIVVTKEDGETLNFGEASGRFFVKLLIGLFGSFSIFFNEQQQALHDQMFKTKVVWQGDDERKLYE